MLRGLDLVAVPMVDHTLAQYKCDAASAIKLKLGELLAINMLILFFSCLYVR